MKIEKTCPFCSTYVVKDIDVERGQLAAWQNGALIQNAMPNLTPDEREHIKTGICDVCWSALGDDE